jgi:hypothetical protein
MSVAKIIVGVRDIINQAKAEKWEPARLARCLRGVPMEQIQKLIDGTMVLTKDCDETADGRFVIDVLEDVAEPPKKVGRELEMTIELNGLGIVDGVAAEPEMLAFALKMAGRWEMATKAVVFCEERKPSGWLEWGMGLYEGERQLIVLGLIQRVVGGAFESHS